MKEQFIENKLKLPEKEKSEISVVLAKTEKINTFLSEINHSNYIVSLNDLILFEKIISGYKEHNLFENTTAQNFMSLLKNSLRLPQNTRDNKISDINLQELKEKIEKEYRLKSLHAYQTDPNTCSVMCYLMAANIYNNSIRPSKENEINLYDDLREDNAENVELYNLVKRSVSDHFHTKVYSQFDYKKKHFDNQNWEIRRQNYNKAMDECAASPYFKEYSDFDIQPTLLKDLLKNGEVVLVNGTTGGGMLHMRLITGYKGDNFIISDPLSRRKEEYTPELIELTCNPPAGKWCMSISNKNFDFYTF